MQPRTGNVTKSGTTLTRVEESVNSNPRWGFNIHWEAGSSITLDGTECVIASVSSEQVLDLADSACIADGCSCLCWPQLEHPAPHHHRWHADRGYSNMEQ